MRPTIALVLGLLVPAPALAQGIAPAFVGEPQRLMATGVVDLAAPMPRPSVDRNVLASAPSRIVTARAGAKRSSGAADARRSAQRSEAAYRERAPARGRDVGRFWPPVF